MQETKVMAIYVYLMNINELMNTYTLNNTFPVLRFY